ncbi:MAG TPA: class I tRNA ligase family protein, partial [Labilithrix sp.]
PAWYIRTTQEISRAIANNQEIHWLPEHIKSGRMGDFLANNVDWALSRERYWGTPLNIWICDEAGHREAPASVDEIRARNPNAFDKFEAAKKADPSLSEHLVVHKPWIDAVTFPCKHAGCGGTMRRVSEVIDCWFDSGCMPFAQWGYPHTGKEQFEKSFPADFISEAIDQTRGWFYSLLMISTLVFDEQKYPHPYKTCVVLGHISDKEGKKESKSKGNYTPPDVILESVQMDFAVLADAPGVTPEQGVALIAREDMEGLDLAEGAKVLVGGTRELAIKPHKKLPRRVVVLHESDRAALKVTPTTTKDVKPVEVPRLPAAERVTILDPSTPAPGADAFRWFFFAASPPWSNTRHSLSNVRDLQKETLVKLRNVYSFFTIYANIDGFDPSKPAGDPKKRGEIDRWILSELNLVVEGVTKDLDAYDVYSATQKIASFVDALSNWYVRRSRERFWKSGFDDDKRAAYETLYTSLVTLAGVMAPFTPYMADAMYKNLVKGGAESVHLTDFPKADASLVDRTLSQTIASVRDLVSLGLQVRTAAKLKVRQPLSVAKVILADPAGHDRLAPYVEMMKDELNVLTVELVSKGAEEYVAYRVKPNFRTLGQKGMGKQAQELKKQMPAIAPAEAQALVQKLLADGKATAFGVELEPADVETAFEAKEGYAAAGDRVGVVVLDTRLTDELRDLGFLRELLNRVQTMRKDMSLDFVDRIQLWLHGSERAARIAKEHATLITRECLVLELHFGEPAASCTTREFDVEGETVRIGVCLATPT